MKLTDDMKTLDNYMGQYRRCVIERNALRSRKKTLLYEFNNPEQVSKKRKAAQESEEAESVSISVRVEKINKRINEQVKESEKVLLLIMDMIDFLPEHSSERLVIEHRYIDRYSWEKIEDYCYISRSQAIRYWKQALEILLEYPKVQKTLSDYRKEQKHNRIHKNPNSSHDSA